MTIGQQEESKMPTPEEIKVLLDRGFDSIVGKDASGEHPKLQMSEELNRTLIVDAIEQVPLACAKLTGKIPPRNSRS